MSVWANAALQGEVNRGDGRHDGDGHLVTVDIDTLIAAVGLSGFETALPRRPPNRRRLPEPGHQLRRDGPHR